MTMHDDGEPRVTPDEAAFLARLKAEFAPAPLSLQRRAAFDAALDERVAERWRRRRSGLPLLAAAAADAALAWVVLPGALRPAAEPESAPAPTLAEARATLLWEDELFDAMSFGEADAVEESDPLPEEYAAIADAFLDG